MTTGVKLRQSKEYKDLARTFKSGMKCRICKTDKDLCVSHKHVFVSDKMLKDFLNRRNIIASDEQIKRILLIEKERYLSFNDAEVLCKSCHYKRHHIENAYTGKMEMRCININTFHPIRRCINDILGIDD
jgi:hypothetical protein